MPDRPRIVNMTPVPYTATFEELTARLRPPGPDAWAAFIALGHCPAGEALAVLTDLAADPDWRYRRSAVEAIAFHPLGHSAGLTVILALEDSSPYVVCQACKTAADLGLKSAHDAIARLLRARGAPIREAATRALSRLWQPGDFEPMFSLYRNDRSKTVRREAAWALADNETGAHWRQLFEAWVIDPPALSPRLGLPSRPRIRRSHRQVPSADAPRGSRRACPKGR
jgi:HEAT repeat protein